MEYLEAWGTLIHEKNLKSKISCQTPFNVLLGSPCLETDITREAVYEAEMSLRGTRYLQKILCEIKMNM